MLSKTAKNITPSVTVELSGMITDLKTQGVDVVEMNIGEPDFLTPSNIVEACKKAMDEGKMKYVNSQGIVQLRKAVCAKLEKENSVVYNEKQICISTGAKQALYNAVLAIVDPGDEVIIPTPAWVSYCEMVKMAAGIPVFVKTKNNFQLDINAIRSAVTSKTKAIMINTPNNPSGAVYSAESLEALGELAVEKNFYIISDEVYEKFIYGDKKHYCIASFSKEIYERTIVVNGFSKAYAMTGWRIGYTAAPPDVARAISSIQGHTTSNSTTMVQWASIEALEHGDDARKEMINEFQKRKEYTYKRLAAIPGIKCHDVDGAFYLMPDVSAYFNRKTPEGNVLKNPSDLCGYILKSVHVALVPGEAFMAPDNVRVAYTNSMEKLKIGLDRLEECLGKLKY
ncbi:MAG: pyridoxal phosphate-dependent aminotransferase [Clostridiaceae bacterium]